jgi:RNA polymerase primary sigma factor
VIGVSPDLLEDDLRPHYDAWKAAPGPATNTAMLKALHPTLEGAIRTHVGEPNPLLMSQARLIALQGLKSYDPKRGRLQSHMYNQLLGLKRSNRKQTTIVRVPERVSLDRYHLGKAEDELRNELGREPTDDELADHTGFNPARIARVRSYKPGVSEGAMEAAGEGNVFGGVRTPGPPQRSTWADVVYDELDDHHKKVMELAFGVNGRRPLQNQEIARKMNRSPGAISQAKARIQKLLDEEHELAPEGL